MSTKDTLAVLVDIAAKLEADGAEIIAAGFDKIAGPRLHLWGPSLPSVVQERGELIEVSGKQRKVGYTNAGITVFWVEAGA